LKPEAKNNNEDKSTNPSERRETSKQVSNKNVKDQDSIKKTEPLKKDASNEKQETINKETSKKIVSPSSEDKT